MTSAREPWRSPEFPFAIASIRYSTEFVPDEMPEIAGDVECEVPGRIRHALLRCPEHMVVRKERDLPLQAFELTAQQGADIVKNREHRLIEHSRRATIFSCRIGPPSRLFPHHEYP